MILTAEDTELGLDVGLRKLLLRIEVRWTRTRGTTGAEAAVHVSVEEIQDEPDHQPDSEAPPRSMRQLRREHQARCRAQHRYQPGTTRYAERPLAIRLFVAQDRD